MLKSLSPSELGAVICALEDKIFRSPPFEKPNEAARRRNLAIALFATEQWPKLLPNGRVVLTSCRGKDALMHYVMGRSKEHCMTGYLAAKEVIKHYEQAVKLQPDYPEAAEGLARARAVDLDQLCEAGGSLPAPTHAPVPAEAPAAAATATAAAPPATGAAQAEAPDLPERVAPSGFEWGGTF